ncbi:hypothetical protein WME91_09905 [Sorangium sp. So ce269]
MILLKKSGKKSIRFEFDRTGALDLEAAFGEDRRVVSILVERALLGGRQARRGGFAEIPFQVSPEDEGAGTIVLQPDKVLLRIDDDSAAYVQHRLHACIPDGFFPAEIGEISLGTGGDTVSLYGDYKEPLTTQ